MHQSRGVAQELFNIVGVLPLNFGSCEPGSPIPWYLDFPPCAVFCVTFLFGEDEIWRACPRRHGCPLQPLTCPPLETETT